MIKLTYDRRNRAPERSRDRQSGFWWIRATALGLAVVAAVVATFVIYHAEAILRGRVVETLSTRFRGRVELSASTSP
jgi:hypothetical protein